MSARRIFISYGRKDATQLAERLEQDLTSRGFEVWRDKSQLRAGREWEQQIIDGLRSTQVVIALLSPHSTRSISDPANPSEDDSVCLDELACARFQPPPNPIVPAMVLPGSNVPLTIYRLQYIDMIGAMQNEGLYQQKLGELLEAVERAIAGEPPRYRNWENWLKPALDPIEYLNASRKQFTGREWLFDHVDAWRRTSKSKLLVIKGDPGIGKTAVIAQMSLKQFTAEVLATHCCRFNLRPSLHPAEFVRVIASQLAVRIPAYGAQLETPDIRKKLEAADSDPETAFHAGVVIPLMSLPAPSESRSLLLIDALDEALENSGLTIIELLRRSLSELPDWLGVVVTTRREARVLDTLGIFEADTLDAHDAQNEQDLKAYLKNRSNSPNVCQAIALAKMDPAVFLQQVAEKAQGVFLVARYLLDSIETRQMRIDQIASVPPGLHGVYKDYFRRICPKGQEDFDRLAPTLGAICVAREPLPKPLLANFLKLDEEDLTVLLRPLKGLLSETNEGTSAVGFWHKSLADWLAAPSRAGEDFYISGKKANVMVADWGTTLFEQKQLLAPYLVKFLPSHLFDAGRMYGAWSVLSDLRYLMARVVLQNALIIASDIRRLADAPLRSGENAKLPSRTASQAIELSRCLELSAHILQKNPSELQGQLLLRVGDRQLRQLICTQARETVKTTWLCPKGASLAGATTALIKVLDTGRSITCLRALPDGRLVIGFATSEVCVFDPDSQSIQPARTWRVNGPVNCLALLPNDRLAVGTDVEISLLDLKSESSTSIRVWQTEGELSHIEYCAGRLVIGEYFDAKVLDITRECDTVEQMLGVPDQNADGYSVSRSVAVLAGLCDGRIAVGTYGGLVAVFHPALRPQTPDLILDVDYPVKSLLALNRHQLAVASFRGVAVFDIRTSSTQPDWVIDFADEEGVESLALLPDGRMVMGCGDYSIYVFDPAIESGEAEILFHVGSEPNYLTTLAAGTIAAAGAFEKKVSILCADVRYSEPRRARVLSLINFTGKKIIVGCSDGTVRVCNTDLDLERTLNAGEGVHALLELPDGSLAVGCEHGRLCLFDLKSKSKKPKRVFYTGSQLDTIGDIARLPGGRLAVTTCGGINIFHINSKTKIGPRRIENRNGAFSWCELSPLPENGWVVEYLEDKLHVFSLDSDADDAVSTLEGGSPIRWCRFGPSGQLWAMCNDETLRCFDFAREPNRVSLILESAGDAACLSPTPDGKMLLGCGDGEIRMWAPEHGGTHCKLLLTLDSAVTKILYTSANSVMALTADGLVHTFSLIN